MLIDRWFLAAAVIFLVMVPFSAVGLIHAGRLNFKYDSRGTIVGNENQGGDGGHGQPGWKNVLTYAVSAMFCFFMHLFQKMGLVRAPEPEDYRILQLQTEQELEISDGALMPES